MCLAHAGHSMYTLSEEMVWATLRRRYCISAPFPRPKNGGRNWHRRHGAPVCLTQNVCSLRCPTPVTWPQLAVFSQRRKVRGPVRTGIWVKASGSAKSHGGRGRAQIKQGFSWRGLLSFFMLIKPNKTVRSTLSHHIPWEQLNRGRQLTVTVHHCDLAEAKR